MGALASGKRQRRAALHALCVDIKHYVVFQEKFKGGPGFLRIYLAVSFHEIIGLI
jgi:hypothetical protein